MEHNSAAPRGCLLHDIRHWRILEDALPPALGGRNAEFLRRAKGLLTDADRIALVDWLAANPTAGDLMPGTGGARKLRWRVAGRGKRGGVRAITYCAGPSLPIFLMTVFGKNEKANLSAVERNALRAVLAEIGRQYRHGAR